ncbi:MCE family protein [Mycolicibacterium smegmatis]|uniref:MCE-family protein MCE3a n=2 Tax=Mycolicibacterium smegmatis (strain ATCC 700084 / mc(2)155) TaxID=246196 RepID=I7F5C8_MYCS2|nr:MCE family protein [Mycolicibacterium smegmatis]ABK72335.1 virulence factor [Mycolicibacterium smegmatis MC2 155]AFP36820.1 MCE-family protein MCE3a [Mycolicibacterium smegmatis MC2 155]AIU05624.1 MCE-family protein MCE3A [Mycolicibacterium smegmatis MC2 155]AIU12249.1 MCE-family protein MCE3A [Mycolicibacterium smegmatis]AIU18873.1 MCE-family protein MCE3A [Mycolicibacterium smegmatis]
MQPRFRDARIKPAWWTWILIAALGVFFFTTGSLFAGTFRSFVPVTLVSDRSGLVMETGAKVKLNGVEVGRVSEIRGGASGVSLQLEIEPDQIRFIPANVEARITATTAFGAKYVDLSYPDNPTGQHLAAGAVLRSRNVSTEVNTVFENLTDVLKMVDPAKLNAVLSALAEGFRGQGERMGQAITDANEVLMAINPRQDTIREDWRAMGEVSAAYDHAADDIVKILDAGTTTAETVTSHRSELDTLLLNVIGFGRAGVDLLAPSFTNLVNAVNGFAPTSDLLMKYQPEYTCLLDGSVSLLQNGHVDAFGGNGRSAIFDIGLLLGNDPYHYPDDLPIVGAKGGPGGKPGCGSLPDVAKNFPVRQLVTNTGWGTGLDIRPNPGIGFPGWANYFPVTRGIPQPPIIRNLGGGPAPGPIPYPGAPPYGADLYADDGTPLWPGLPPAPPPSDQPPPDPNNPPPGAEPFVPPAPAAMTPTQ